MKEGGTQMEFFKSMYEDDSAFVNTSRWDVDHSLPLIFNTLKEFSVTMYVGRGDKRGKTEAVFFPCAADVQHTHSKTHTLAYSHILTFARTRIRSNVRPHSHTDTQLTCPTPRTSTHHFSVVKEGKKMHLL